MPYQGQRSSEPPPEAFVPHRPQVMNDLGRRGGQGRRSRSLEPKAETLDGLEVAGYRVGGDGATVRCSELSFSWLVLSHR